VEHVKKTTTNKQKKTRLTLCIPPFPSDSPLWYWCTWENTVSRVWNTKSRKEFIHVWNTWVL